MNKIEEIFKAWKISFNPNDLQSDIASKRIEICDACEFKETLHVGPIDIVTRCKVCGCALKAKMFTPVTYKDPGGSCPHAKWMNVEREWLKIKKTSVNLGPNVIPDNADSDSYVIPDNTKYYESYDGMSYHYVILPKNGTKIRIKCMSTWNITIKIINNDMLDPLTLSRDQFADFVFKDVWIYQIKKNIL